LGLTKKELLSRNVEACLMPLLRPLSRSLQLTTSDGDRDESDVDEDADESEVRLKQMEKIIRGVVEKSVIDAKFEIIASVKAKAAKGITWGIG